MVTGRHAACDLVVGVQHTCAMTDSAVPDAPLPLPQYVRAAVIGPHSAFREAIINAFSTADRRVDLLVPQELSLMTEPLSRFYDVVLITVNPSSLEDMLSDRTELLSDLVVVVCTSSVSRDEGGFFMKPAPLLALVA